MFEIGITVLIYLGFNVTYRGHILTGSFMGRENQYIQLNKFLYYKLPTFVKQLPTFPHRGLNSNLSDGRRVLSLRHHGSESGITSTYVQSREKV